MADCLAMGWGTGVWGTDPWSGPLGGAPGGPIPTYPPAYDVYCVGPCGQMLHLLTYDEVQAVGASGQFNVDLTTEDCILQSDTTTRVNGKIATARVVVDVGVPEDWTFEYTIKFDQLPPGFNNVETEHAYLGCTDATGASAGLLFSLSGIAYTGSLWHDAEGTAHINTAFQVLPDSAALISLGEYFTVRTAVDEGNGIVYVYITRTIDLPVTGHVLRYVLPAIRSASSIKAVVDGTVVSCRGSAQSPTKFHLDSMCLGTGLIIPNVPPQADAGRDQSARKCSIVRLDGRASYDPEGAALSYRWRLVDAPLVSSFILDANDGKTRPPPPSVYTNVLYSEELGEYDAAADTEVAVGDVLVVSGEAYNILAKGIDDLGFFVVVDSYALPVGQEQMQFRLLKQNCISEAASAQPSFYPDVTGVFKFDLVVFDGALYSQPSVTIVNVLESVVPRGCIPDLSFLWNYVSDFWNLVEDKEHITTFWGALAQIAATELLSLWQIEYNKSLRDIQRTFQRRWLHYDLYLPEPQRADSSVGCIYGGVYLAEIPAAGLALAGQVLRLSSPVLEQEVEVLFTGAGLLTEDEIRAKLQLQLQMASPSFFVTKLSNPSSGRSQLRIEAPFPFAVLASSTAAALLPSEVPAFNTEPAGAGGTSAGLRTFLVDRDVSGLGIQADDLLVLGGEAYRIERVLTKPSVDDWQYQRIVVKDDLPLLAPASWRIVRGARSKFLDMHKALLTDGDLAYFEVIDTAAGQSVSVTVQVYGACASLPGALAINTLPLSAYLDSSRYVVQLTGVHRRTYMPVSDLLVSVPALQEKIKDAPDEEVLRENVDYFIEEYRGMRCLRFVTGDPDVWQGTTPPRRMWAETSYIDNRPTIEANFGIPADFTLDDLAQLSTNVDYLSAVRGIWYAYFHGPSLRNLRVGTQILLGLPFAEEEGTIEEIRSDFSSNQGRILVRDIKDKEVVRFYTYPRPLSLEVNPETGEQYKVGDVVRQFAPLIEGVEVVDYVKDPTWFVGYLNQGNFYEVEKFFRFLVRVDSAAFNLNALLFVKSFINKIKPTYTFPKFVVRNLINFDGDAIDITDTVRFSGALHLHCDIASRGLGAWMHTDHPNQAGGGWVGKLDSGYPFTAAAVYPNPTQPVIWGTDKSELVPEDSIFAVMQKTMDGVETPKLDSIWSSDHPALREYVFSWDRACIDHVPAANTPGYPLQIGEEHTAATAVDGFGLTVEMTFLGPLAEAITLECFLKVGTAEHPAGKFIMTLPAGIDAYRNSFYLAADWQPGDVVSFFLRPVDDSIPLTAWGKILLSVGVIHHWKLDEAPPAGIYTATRLM